MLKRFRYKLFGFIGIWLWAGILYAQVYTEKNTHIIVFSAKPTFTIKLKSNPTTGYSWVLQKSHARFITLIHHKFEPPQNKKLIGAPGYEVWKFRVLPGAFAARKQMRLRFKYIRPWEHPPQGEIRKIDFLITISSDR